MQIAAWLATGKLTEWMASSRPCDPLISSLRTAARDREEGIEGVDAKIPFRVDVPGAEVVWDSRVRRAWDIWARSTWR